MLQRPAAICLGQNRIRRSALWSNPWPGHSEEMSHAHPKHNRIYWRKGTGSQSAKPEGRVKPVVYSCQF